MAEEARRDELLTPAEYETTVTELRGAFRASCEAAGVAGAAGESSDDEPPAKPPPPRRAPQQPTPEAPPPASSEAGVLLDVPAPPPPPPPPRGSERRPADLLLAELAKVVGVRTLLSIALTCWSAVAAGNLGHPGLVALAVSNGVVDAAVGAALWYGATKRSAPVLAACVVLVVAGSILTGSLMIAEQRDAAGLCRIRQSAFKDCTADTGSTCALTCIAEDDGNGACDRDDLDNEADGCDCRALNDDVCDESNSQVVFVAFCVQAALSLFTACALSVWSLVAYQRLETEDALYDFYLAYYHPLQERVGARALPRPRRRPPAPPRRQPGADVTRARAQERVYRCPCPPSERGPLVYRASAQRASWLGPGRPASHTRLHRLVGYASAVVVVGRPSFAARRRAIRAGPTRP